MRNAATGTVKVVTHASCTDSAAARPPRATSCTALAQANDAVLSWLDGFDVQLGEAASSALTGAAAASDKLKDWTVALIAALGAAVFIMLLLVIALCAKKKKEAYPEVNKA